MARLISTAYGADWVEVCSANGIKFIAADKTSPSQPMDIKTDSHCGFCLLQQQTPVLLGSLTDWHLPVLSSSQLAIGSGGTTIYQRAIRHAHPSHAPPVFS